jgi:hypothetical protein
VALEVPGAATFRVTEWGETAVAYIQLSAEAAPLLAGPPGDVYSCPHWRYVLERAIHVRYADGKDEVSRAGEMFYWPPGHTVRVEEDTRFVEFKAKQELKEVYGHIGARLSAPTAVATS